MAIRSVINMLADHVHFNLCLCVVAGLCLPSGVVKLKWPLLYHGFILLSDVLLYLNVITLATNVMTPEVPLTERCFSGFTTLATSQAIVKLISCHLNKHKFREYFELWDLLIEKNADAELKARLVKKRKTVKKLSLCIFVLMVGPMIPWCCLPLIIKILSYLVPDWSNSYSFIAIPALFPFEDPLASPAFEFINIFQGLAALTVNAKTMAHDCFIYALFSFQIVQCQRLRRKFEEIVSLLENNDEDQNLHKIQNMELNKWVKEHCNLLIVYKSLNAIYSPVLLLQFFFNTLILCLNAFVVTSATVTTLELLFSAGYVMGNMVQLFMLCWLGEEMANQSSMLTSDGFWRQWYISSPEVLSSLRIIYEKTKIPVNISAFGTFHLSVETFKSIVGTSYSYFMVLRHIKNKASRY